jgi:6-phosphofructokinase 1
LQTGRYEELKDDARLAAFKLRTDSIGLDRLVVLGGDGSFRCALKLSKLGLGAICVPATIDNNIPGTDYTLGFDTAINKTLKNINDIGDTGSSMPGKVYILETLGGDSGNIAKAAYNCGAADIAIVPEDNRCDDEVIDMVEEVFRSGKQYVIISIGEGVGKTMYYSKLISDRLGRKVHETIIGHQQRGGSPTAFDRMMAAEFALQAKKIIDEGLPLNMVAYRKGNTIGQDYGIFLK